jgi:hypothetical protein
MNSQQAKFILQGYRSNGADAGDAIFCEALEHARNDPALHVWLAREQAFDSAISGKLTEVRPPAGLREAILAGARVTASEAPGRVWWRQSKWLAMAAGIALIFAITLTLRPKSAIANNALTGFALADARHAETHGGRGEEVGVLQAALSEPSARLGGNLPVDFASLRKTGCRTLGFRGRDVLEVCFQRNGVWFHCYISQRIDFPALAAATVPVVADQDGVSSATWANAGHLYVVVSETGRSALEKLL